MRLYNVYTPSTPARVLGNDQLAAGVEVVESFSVALPLRKSSAFEFSSSLSLATCSCTHYKGSKHKKKKISKPTRKTAN